MLLNYASVKPPEEDKTPIADIQASRAHQLCGSGPRRVSRHWYLAAPTVVKVPLAHEPATMGSTFQVGRKAAVPGGNE